MQTKSDTDDYRNLFLNNVPLMDVRAPVEFNKGAFPGATNIPLLDDLQREAIGLRYKQAGEEQAIKLGLELATPEIRTSRIEHWSHYHRSHPEALLYCFRGGLRSRTTQSWLAENNIDMPLIRGGYKAMRRFLIDELESNVSRMPLVMVSGLTGSGKTRVLKQITRHIDFEGIANHRGSAFGRDAVDRQPSSINWENQVSIEFLKLSHSNNHQPIFIEDEGRRIGRVSIPESLFEKMQNAPRAILEMGMEKRIQLILEDYILDAWPQYEFNFGHSAELEFNKYVLDNLARIKKRLGGDRYDKVKQHFETALCAFYSRGCTAAFVDGIKILLTDYYDPMYRYQLHNKNVEIIFRGSEIDYLEWANDFCKDNRV